MGNIPVLSDSQMTSLRRVVGTNQRFDLTVTPKGKARRIPAYPEDEKEPEYDGPFALNYNADKDMIEVKAGFLSRNGDFGTVPAKSVSPSNGYVCVMTAIDNAGNWTTPDVGIVITPDATHYPIGYCEVKGRGAEKTVSVTSYRVAVAIFIIAGDCQ